MEIRSFGSDSSGNSYLITSGGRSLLLEAGIPLKKLHGIDWSSVDACLITHEHGDHTKYAKDLLKRTGIDLYLSAGTQEVLEISSYRIKTLKALTKQNIGSWTVLPFDVQHDVNEPLGFLIQAPGGEKILFATDTYYIKYQFPGVTHLMIECNYAMDILKKNVESGRLGAFLSNRVIKSHFELNNVKKFIQTNDLSQLQEVWLLHLSNGNSDEKRFKREIQEITGTPVYIAE
ncbi:MBL fold metallo-hydrolase [Desemzia sp. C1]|uniref:MBL fold metallo-hydrolase n=1 Tax=Desemzia sp. C1 TaxID=2892016 RepID=UPI00241525FE|nr:MBL fold metallo-hydrolase [Desemzia sp. C1]